MSEKLCPFCGKSENAGGAWLEKKEGNSEVYFRDRKLHLVDKQGIHAICKLLQHKGYTSAEDFQAKIGGHKE